MSQTAIMAIVLFIFLALVLYTAYYSASKKADIIDKEAFSKCKHCNQGENQKTFCYDAKPGDVVFFINDYKIDSGKISSIYYHISENYEDLTYTIRDCIHERVTKVFKTHEEAIGELTKMCVEKLVQIARENQIPHD